MQNSINHHQLMFSGFESEFEQWLDPDNRWIKLSKVIPWNDLSQAYNQTLSPNQGRPGKPARLVIGAVIIKHKLCLSDDETIAQIQENPYLQYFVGMPGFHKGRAFAPSLFVEIRKRMGAQVFKDFEQSIINSLDTKPPATSTQEDHDDEPPSGTCSEDAHTEQAPSTHQGKLILDATVAEQAIRYPTDLGLLNEAREISEKIIDELYPKSGLKKKPRTYRKKARKDYLAIIKRRRPGKKLYRKGNKQQLQYLRRNLKHIEKLLDSLPTREIPLSYKRLRQYWIIQILYAQQKQMYDDKSQRCDDRIVSISQPHVRPIIRGKQNKPVEFGAKLSVSLTGKGIACVDEMRWDAFHEAMDLPSQVEAYRVRHGCYPEKVLADPLYGTRENRRYLKERGIHYAGKPLGRPKKATEENEAQLEREKRQRRKDYLQRIPIEGKLGQSKNGYGLNRIRAKTAKTSFAWINCIFLVMNLLVLSRFFLWPGYIRAILTTLCRFTSKNTAIWFESACLPEVRRVSNVCRA